MNHLFHFAQTNPKFHVGCEISDPEYFRYFLFAGLCFSLEDYSNGYCSEIFLILTEDNYISFESYGMCIPNEIHSSFPTDRIQSGATVATNGKATFLELFMSTFHFISAHEVFDKFFQYGPHRDGIYVLNALSSDCVVTLWTNGFEWTQSFMNGKPIDNIQRGKQTEKSGMRFSFRPYTTLLPNRSSYRGLNLLDVINWLKDTPERYLRGVIDHSDIPITVIQESSNESHVVSIGWY